MSKKKEPLYVWGRGRHEDNKLAFGADPEVILHDYDLYAKFVKGIEHAVRKDDRYTKYVGKIRLSGFNHCAVLGHAADNMDKVELEMHHGPIFNLFDICDIVLKHCLNKGDIDNLTTFDVADIVLTEHEKDHIQVVMLTQTAHKAAHKSNMFIDTRASVGRLDKFIDKFCDGMEDDHWDKISRYLDRCKKYGGTLDKGLFDTVEKLTEYKK